MQIVILLLSIVFMFVFYALFVKLAAFLLRRTKISWKHSFVFALMVSGLVMTRRATSLAFGHSLSLVWSLLLSLTFFLVIGGWFFSTRAKSINGEFLGWRGAIKLSALTWGLFGLIALVILGGGGVFPPY